MPIIDATPQTDALTAGLLAEGAEAALVAVRRVRELEREVTFLRGALAAMPANARRDPAWKEKVAHLLSRVVLFRVAVLDEAERGNMYRPS